MVVKRETFFPAGCCSHGLVPTLRVAAKDDHSDHVESTLWNFFVAIKTNAQQGFMATSQTIPMN